MISLESPAPSPELPTHKPSLADLSRNASVISSESSSSSNTSLVLPVRPRPIRTFSSPRSRSPGGPPTPKASRPPAYITRELGIVVQHVDALSGRSRANSKSKSKSRSSSANGRLSADDFEFGDVLGEGSYSTVRTISPNLVPRAFPLSYTRHNHRSCMAHTVRRGKNTRSKCSTRVTSSATTSSIPPSQRKTLSSALALVTQVSSACTGHFRMNGVSVS